MIRHIKKYGAELLYKKTAYLTEALDWIMYGYYPLDEPYKIANTYEKKHTVKSPQISSEEARLRLFLNIFSGKIAVMGYVAHAVMYNLFDGDGVYIKRAKAKLEERVKNAKCFASYPLKDHYVSAHFYQPAFIITEDTPQRITPPKLFEQIHWDFDFIHLYGEDPTNHNGFSFVSVDFDDLIKHFPCGEDVGDSVNIRAPEANEYTTLYLELMKEAISENKITAENQGNVESLKQWFVDKGISIRLASAMATLIRRPESQAGAGRKRKNG